jgi:phosphatidylinositol-3-phosphatase
MSKTRYIPTVVLATVLAGLALTLSRGHTPPTPNPKPTPTSPRFDHIVVVVDENHSYDQILAGAPYITSLTKQGANFTNSHALAHPSEPNYLMLFSGSDQGITGDKDCAHRFTADNLGHQLISAGLSFTGFSEALPYPGYRGCNAGAWAQRHAPWASFNGVPLASNMPLSTFPSDYANLPAVSFVTPDLTHDMHDGTIAVGDAWLKSHFGGYIQWAKTHNSLFILTFDEDDNDASGSNTIMTLMAGAHVKAGPYNERIDHYVVLRTLEDLSGLPALGGASGASAIKDVWTKDQY